MRLPKAKHVMLGIILCLAALAGALAHYFYDRGRPVQHEGVYEYDYDWQAVMGKLVHKRERIAALVEAGSPVDLVGRAIYVEELARLRPGCDIWEAGARIGHMGMPLEGSPMMAYASAEDPNSLYVLLFVDLEKKRDPFEPPLKLSAVTLEPVAGFPKAGSFPLVWPPTLRGKTFEAE